MRAIIEKRINKLKELNKTEDSIAKGYNRSLIRELQSILDEQQQELNIIADQLAVVRDWMEIPEETEAGINGVIDNLIK